MICYTHRDKQAVAVCKNCYKAICEECAIPDENGFTCSEYCHQEILAVKLMMDKSKAVYGLKPGRAPITMLFLIIASIPFIILGVINLSTGYAIGYFPLSMGLLFLVLGIISYINLKKTGIRS